ncbi:MAG: acyl-CoA dehydrogenase family protein [Chloroflexi bacterium SZAS-1]|nr:acyl-CoA dehydrogenase family protein [Chloroflexi bacterium SZAS-1]
MDHPGRAALRSWLDSRPANFFEANQPLQRALRMHWGDERFAALRPRLSAFGETSATTIDEAARVNDRIGNHPRLDAYTGIGEQTEAIEFHPSYYIAGRAAYESGMLAVQAQPGNILFQGALFYLLCHNGEMGHACPIACTAGLILALQQRADPAVRARFLPPLLCDRYDELQHGAQFLTEVQGGSDVGANTLAAAPVAGKPDVWQLSGEKWFCSNINAQQFLVMARPEGAPEGTRGLGLFLVPRTREDGRVNGFRIRRLKNKIGTRTMASAEVDFAGALAYQLGPIEAGFKIVVELVLNTSRQLNALACCGLMARALLEARAYASQRQAFGQAINTYPLVRETLADMAVAHAAALASSLHLAALVDRMQTGVASAREQGAYRLLVNLNKYATSIAATATVHQAIELFGGNGAIEDFSVLPRLYRDAIVLESWEGTHNVLCLQALRDMARYRVHEPFLAELEAIVAAIQRPQLGHICTEIASAIAAARALAERVLALEPRAAEAHARRLADALIAVAQAAYLLRDATWAADAPTQALAELFVRQHLRPGYSPLDDVEYLGLVEQAAAG